MVGPESGNQTEKANLMLVSGEYFQVLGVNAVLGRTLTAADNQTLGAHPVAALSYSFWQRRFAGDPAVIGKVVSLKKQPLALGAQRRDVVGLVLRETMLLVFIGVIIGLGAALASTRLIINLLYGLTPNDPLTIALAGLMLLTVAALAGYLPARRAARVDPMVALRQD